MEEIRENTEEENMEIKTEEEQVEGDLDKEINLLEFDLDDDQIDDLMIKLSELREHKENFQFKIDEDNDLLINHAESEYEEGPAYDSEESE